jgi:hypothetical protein
MPSPGALAQQAWSWRSCSDVVVAGVFVLFGVFATKKHLWAFIVGMILYALDGMFFSDRK